MNGHGNRQKGYTIKEAMDIYDLTADTLYYYEEKGLIRPRRDEGNGYRIFSAEEFYRLNIITELRSMGFDLASIKEYLDCHTLDGTMALLNAELSSVERALEQLHQEKHDVLTSIQRFAHAVTLARSETTTIAHIPERSCLFISDELIHYTEIPYHFAKKAHESSVSMGTMHSTPCYVVNQNIVQDNGCFAPEVILLYSESKGFDEGYTLASGLYATCTFKGSLDKAPKIYASMLRYIHEQGYEACGSAIEFCLIGEYESSNRDEYVNRLEVPVKQIA